MHGLTELQHDVLRDVFADPLVVLEPQVGAVEGLEHQGRHTGLRQQFPRPFDVANEMVRVTRPGGRIVVADRPGLVAPYPDEDEAAQ